MLAKRIRVLFQKNNDEDKHVNQEYISYMKSAIQELHEAENLLNNVTDPDLVDYATHKMNAAIAKINHLRRCGYEE